MKYNQNYSKYQNISTFSIFSKKFQILVRGIYAVFEILRQTQTQTQYRRITRKLIAQKMSPEKRPTKRKDF